MVNLPVYDFTAKKKFPSKIPASDYAVIKLKKFDNFEVVVMIDEKNGGITVSYDDSALGPAERLEIEKEIETIISDEMNKIWEED
jgi:hypothetical protein